MRILLVEDDADTRTLVTEYLTQNGHQVEIADRAFGVASRVASRHPVIDVVVLDLMMPMLDGDTVLGFLQRDPVTARTPVILHSAADASRLERVAGLHDGCTVVPKGRLSSLLAAINALAPR